jgi:NodT family efflux transporter outer membrane factor (OMF) lipoprotein
VNRRPACAALIGVLALAGCATSAPSPKPLADMPAAFTGPVAAQAGTPEAGWWASFSAPPLVALEAEAAWNNRDVAAATARIQQAEAQAAIQRSALLPQLGLQGGGQGGGCRGSACQQYTGVTNASIALSATYNADLWGLGRQHLRAANETRRATVFARQSLALTVAASVANQYFSVLAIRRRIAIAHDNIAAIDTILDAIRLRVKVGSASSLDLAREQAQIEGVRAQLSGLEIAERQALFALAVLVGRAPEGFDIAPRQLDALTVPAVAPGLPSDMLLRRPDIRAAESNLSAASANVLAARAAFLLQISLTGSGGAVSGVLGGLVTGPGLGFGLGASLLQTIFDGGKLRAQRRLAEGVEREYAAAYQGAALSAFADVENALVELEQNRKAQERLLAENEAAAQAFSIAQLQYQQGATDLLNVLQAQQTLFLAQDQLAQSVLARCQAAVHLYQALGGGWA